MNMFYLAIIVPVCSVIIIWLIMQSGRNYSVHDTEAHAISYANEIKEGHGGLTLFLWVSFLVIFIWTIVYLVQHWSEFSVIFSQ
jgi:hypothetical protein